MGMGMGNKSNHDNSSETPGTANQNIINQGRMPVITHISPALSIQVAVNRILI